MWWKMAIYTPWINPHPNRRPEGTRPGARGEGLTSP
jgi:hypothetical protein